MFLLSIIPNASSYDASKFSPEKMVNLIRQIDIPPTVAQLTPPPPPQGGIGQTQPMGRHQYMGRFSHLILASNPVF
jgi:cleavage stimulation factor subunit 3